MKKSRARLFVGRETIRALKASNLRDVVGGADGSERNCVAAQVDPAPVVTTGCVAG